MATKGVTIKKGRPGVSVLGGASSTSGLIMNGVAVADKIALGEVKELYSPEDAEALGLDADYDALNKVRVFYHIKEFFRMAGKGRKLYIMLVAQSVTLTDMATDAAGAIAKKLVIDANGECYQLGLVRNPDEEYEATLLNGLDADVLTAIPAAQALHDWTFETDRPCNIILEGREFNGTAAAAQNLREIENVSATNVSVIIGQDYDYAETQDAIGKKHAAVGTALGCLSAINVNQNIGETATMNIMDANRGIFVNPGLSSHQLARDVESSWDTLDAKGYIFCHSYSGYPGIYWNDDHTCTPIVLDSDDNFNEYKISYGRTMGMAARRLKLKYMPKVKSVQKLDPATGKLPSGSIMYLERLGDEVFEEMADLISGGKTYVDPDSNLSVSPKILNISFTVVPDGTIEQIAGAINLKTQL